MKAIQEAPRSHYWLKWLVTNKLHLPQMIGQYDLLSIANHNLSGGI